MKDNILNFTGRKARSTEVRDVMNKAKAAAEANFAGPVKTIHLPPGIDATAAVQVVKALQFYAKSGFDHGEMAKKALTGMLTVLDSLNTQPQGAPT